MNDDAQKHEGIQKSSGGKESYFEILPLSPRKTKWEWIARDSAIGLLVFLVSYIATLFIKDTDEFFLMFCFLISTTVVVLLMPCRLLIFYFIKNIYVDGNYVNIQRIKPDDLLKRWGRNIGQDFVNIILETKLTVYLNFEMKNDSAFKIKYFHSPFYPDDERGSVVHNSRCFFDLNEVRSIERNIPRLRTGNGQCQGESQEQIQQLEKDRNGAKTEPARLARAEKRAEKANKDSLFFAHMMLEMVKDPAPKAVFTRQKYRDIAKGVARKAYIKEQNLNHPSFETIDRLRKSLPVQFRNEGNAPK